MNITIMKRDDTELLLLYSSTDFMPGLTVTSYEIFPNLSKSDVITATDLGDGIYALTFPFSSTNHRISERQGIVVKEDGTIKHFEVIEVIK